MGQANQHECVAGLERRARAPNDFWVEHVMTHVLIIDDDVTRLHNVSRIVEAEGLSVASASDATHQTTTPGSEPDIVLLAMPPANEHYFEDRHIFPAGGTSHNEPVIVIAGSGASPEDVAAGVRSAVHALRVRDRRSEHNGQRHAHTGAGYGAAPPENSGAAQHEALGPLTFIPGTPLAEVERQVILATLAANGGARNKTATALGISQKTLYNKLRQFEAKAEVDARVNPIASQ